MKHSITPYLSTIKLGRRQRPSTDLAQLIWNNCMNNIVTLRDPDSIWTLSIWVAKGTEEKPAFINLPEGKIHSLQLRPNKGMDDGRLYDDAPEWVGEVTKFMKLTAPPEVAT